MEAMSVGYYLPAKEDGVDVVVVDIHGFPSRDVSILKNSLLFSKESWRSQEKKVVLFKLPFADKDFLQPALEAGFNIHKIEDEHMMLVLELGGDEPPTPPVASASNQVAGGPGFVVKDQQAIDAQPAEVEGFRRQSHGVALGDSDRKTDPICYSPSSDNILKPPVTQTKKRAHPPGKSAQIKRNRGQNWTEEEKFALLVEKLEWFLSAQDTLGKPGESWSKSVSKILLEKYGIDRSFKSCQQQWDSLLKQKKSIEKWQSKSGTSTWVCFWEMSEDEKSNARSNGNEKLPEAFKMKWYELMTKIIHVQRNFPGKDITAHSEQEYSVATTNDNLANTQGSQQPEGEDSDMPQDDLIARIASFVKKQIEEGLQPLRAALQTQEGEQKYRDRMLATQAGQLDVMRQEMQLVTSVLVNTMGIAESNGAQAGAATIFETDLDAALHADPYLSDEMFANAA